MLMSGQLNSVDEREKSAKQMKVSLIKTEICNPVDVVSTSPLGILYLAAVAEQQGHEVQTCNMSVISSVNQVVRELEKVVAFQPAVIGLSCLASFSSVFQTVARYFRQKLPGALLIGGGPYASNDYEEILAADLVDVCVIGEGEDVFRRLLDRREKGEGLFDLAGIAFKQNGNIQINPTAEYIEDLDALPFPAWHHNDFEKNRHFIAMSQFAKTGATMLTSRGCPFHCIYCHNLFGKRFRARSAENVLAEIELLWSKHQVKNIEFVDDYFNCDRQRAKDILTGIRDRFPDVGIAFPNGLRVDLLDEETIALMREAHTWHLSVAVETTSQRLQKMVRKNLNLEKIDENLYLLKKHKIFTRGFFMIGFPTETMEEVENTLKYSMHPGLNYSLIFIVTPFNDNEMRKLIPPATLEKILAKKTAYDYQWTNFSICDIHFETLSAIQKKYFRKGLLRLRNWPVWLSAIKVHLSQMILLRDIWALLIPISSTLGLRNKEKGINKRESRFEKLKTLLNTGARRPLPR